MSTIHATFRSEALMSNGEFYMHMPDKEVPFFMADNPHYKRPPKTLILLHGFSGDCHDWFYGSNVQHFSMMYNLAVVMPTGGLNFYLDRPETGRKYCKFIGEDLIKYLRDTFGLAMTKEDTFIGGNSMGGFGSLHTALTYPDRFSHVIALSSALIIHQLKHMKPDDPNPMANYDYYVSTFGDLSKAEDTDANPEVLYKKLKAEGAEIPRIFMACGTEDFLLNDNRILRDFLQAEGADFEYREGPGMHDWIFWTPYCEQGIKWALNIEE